MRRVGQLVLLMGLGGALATQAGCRRSHVAGTVSTDAALEAFGGIGYDTQGVKPIAPEAWSAGNCSEGMISGLEVVLCEYQTDEALATGEQKIQDEWNASNVDTGVVSHNGRTLLVVADQKLADPGGRIIVRLVHAFRDLH
jgi:hypothetical protein